MSWGNPDPMVWGWWQKFQNLSDYGAIVCMNLSNEPESTNKCPLRVAPDGETFLAD